MNARTGWKKYRRPILFILMIPAVAIVGAWFGLPKTLVIPLVMILGLAAATAALWIHAHKNADGSEWWHDDSASGWRGY